MLPARHHTYRCGVLLTKSEKTVVIQIQYATRFLFSFAQWRIIFEALLLFPYPLPFGSKSISSRRQRASGNWATQTCSQQRVCSKAALCASALMFAADASLLGNFKLFTFGRLSGLIGNQTDQEHHPLSPGLQWPTQ